MSVLVRLHNFFFTGSVYLAMSSNTHKPDKITWPSWVFFFFFLFKLGLPKTRLFEDHNEFGHRFIDNGSEWGWSLGEGVTFSSVEGLKIECCHLLKTPSSVLNYGILHCNLQQVLHQKHVAVIWASGTSFSYTISHT